MSDSDEKLWVVDYGEIVPCVTDSLDSAEAALRRAYYQDTGYNPMEMGDRLTFDLKFSQWVLFLDRQPLWGYTASRARRL